MKRGSIVALVVVIIFVAVASLVAISLLINKEDVKPNTQSTTQNTPVVKVEPTMESTPVASQTVDFQEYNYQFVEGPKIEGILDRLVGENGKVEFYLPPTNYINVTRGKDFGVAFAINNPSPSGDNYFEYEFKADESTLNSCGVDEKTANSWISMGFKSFGKVPKGWVDKMSVYFIFKNVPKSCIAKYNFKITKDGVEYSTKQLKFNLI